MGEPMTTPATPAPLPAEAVEAAAAAIHLATCNLPGCLDGGGHRTTARVALEAAAPHLAAAERDATVTAMYAGAAKAVENAVAAERERILKAATGLARSFQGRAVDVVQLSDLRDLLRQEGGT